MPSAKTARPTADAAGTRSTKRVRVSHVSRRNEKDASGSISDDDEVSATVTSACKVPKFLRSLYAILQTEDPHIISWVQNKDLKPNSVTAFHILEMKHFEREILPKYFKHQKFASFQRQLNNFGFRKWTKTQSSGVCTFSHNCFPPDLSTANQSRMPIREQWRQKSTQVLPAPSSLESDMSLKRNMLGKTSAPRKRPAVVRVPAYCVPDASLLADMYHSPNANASPENNGFRPNRSHQPPAKKLARPNLAMKPDVPEPYHGLEAFCDESFKQFLLPPLQPHHLVATTSRNAIRPPSFSRPSESGSSGLNGFRFSGAHPSSCHPLAFSADLTYNSTGPKPYEIKNSDVSLTAYPSVVSNVTMGNAMADAAALQGAFLEPWIWDAQVSSSNFEVESFSLEYDNKSEFDGKDELNWQEGTSNNAFLGAHAMSCSIPSKEVCQRQECDVASSVEDFGLDNLLFVE